MLAELRAGLATVQVRRGRLGSIDLQTAAGRSAPTWPRLRPAAGAGRGSARHVFAWLERSRAQAFRVQAGPPARRPARGGDHRRASPARLPDPQRRAERRPRDPAATCPARPAAARSAGAQLAGRGPGQVTNGGPSPRSAPPRWPPVRSWSASCRSRRALLAVVAARRAGPALPAGRLRGGRRGRPAADRRPRRGGRAAAARPARGGHQGVDPTSDRRADRRDHRPAAAPCSATAALVIVPGGRADEHSVEHASRPARAAR